MLEVQHLTKVYPDGTVALTDVNFVVRPGEFLVVIGLSGSGKSTLLRCINRLIEPTEGKVLWNGIDITSADPQSLRKIRRDFGMVFQQFNIVQRLSVQMNVLTGRLGYVNPLYSLLYRFTEDDYRMAEEALRKVGLSDMAFKRAKELSGGQQQRVGIARALMQQPKVILADEPVASLDPVLAHSILGYLERINQEEGITIICSLHYLDLVQRYASRVIGLRSGRLVYEGSKEDIRRMTDAQFKEVYGEEAERIAPPSLVGGIKDA